ncbi:hypothetical protein CVT26_006665 [Gymnopilus dilepis]|uniref:Uncharacterized protein n=1 Tax=Gymnopilus dilepis TaxID=231916 RepID=A0A409Y2Q6_9AGAR|nr:hypothetical protein CVT26_006665 [Gymnopilus dilepis]
MASSHNIHGSTAESLHQGNLDLDMSKFSGKEREEIESWQQEMNDRSKSQLQRDIARAKLNDLISSKKPEPHNRSHVIRELDEERGVDTATFSKDEAFERYVMGGNQPGNNEKGRNRGEDDFYAVKRNHKAPGQRKQWAREDYLHEAATDTRESFPRK